MAVFFEVFRRADMVRVAAQQAGCVEHEAESTAKAVCRAASRAAYLPVTGFNDMILSLYAA
jgi:hypothetical protein